LVWPECSLFALGYPGSGIFSGGAFPGSRAGEDQAQDWRGAGAAGGGPHLYRLYGDLSLMLFCGPLVRHSGGLQLHHAARLCCRPGPQSGRHRHDLSGLWKQHCSLQHLLRPPGGPGRQKEAYIHRLPGRCSRVCSSAPGGRAGPGGIPLLTPGNGPGHGRPGGGSPDRRYHLALPAG